MTPQQRLLTLATLICLLLSGCNTTPPSADVPTKPFNIRQLGKSDIDNVAEVHVGEMLYHLEALMLKHYRRNPRELQKGVGGNLETAVKMAFGATLCRDALMPQLQGCEKAAPVGSLSALKGKSGAAVIQLAFDEDYHGDRVFAFGVGLQQMLLAAYNSKREFFLTDELDPQKLYNSARNLEIAAWKLHNDRDPDGHLYLLSDSTGNERRNLSYERLFGKLIAIQDALAKIIAGHRSRTIRQIIQRLAGAVFLPI